MACNNEPKQSEQEYRSFEGKTMGTYYRVTYADSLNRDFAKAIDQLLIDINNEVSTYIPTSTISQFNQTQSALDITGKIHFIKNLQGALKVYNQSNGAFDPTVMPLVNYWGFGYTEKKPVTQVDSVKIDSLIQLVGADKIQLEQTGNQTVLKKSEPGVQIDFSGIATGYALDTIGRFLEYKGVKNYLADIGGEQRARGVNPKGKIWTIGINIPEETAAKTAILNTVELKDWTISTSGNYRNFYEVNGVKYSHTINPKTGFPERNTLLSATVFAAECIDADAWATAFMVMGIDKAFDSAEQNRDVEAYFIYSDPADGSMQVKFTSGLKHLFENSRE
ncbi:MAG: FAD:protein FMN transferase [Saprospiraceae bacterium]